MDSIRAAGRALWEFIATIVGVAIVAPVRHGTLRLREHRPAIAGIAWVVAGVTGVIVIAIAKANVLRASTDLIAIVDESGSSIVPAFLVPGVLLLVALSIALVLAGSQGLRWWERVLLLVMCVAILGALVISSSTAAAAAMWVPWAVVAALAGYCLLIWTGRTNADADFFILFALTTTIAVLSYRAFAAGMQMMDTRFDLLTTKTLLVTLTSLAMPIVFVSGLSATMFGASITEQAGVLVARRTPVRFACVVLASLIVLQIIVIWPGLLQRWAGSWRDALGAVIGAAAVLGLCALVWRLAKRIGERRDETEAGAAEITSTVAFPIAYGLTAPLLIGNVFGLIATMLGWWPAAQSAALAVMNACGESALIRTVRILVILGVTAAAIRLSTRGRQRAAAVLILNAVMLTVVLFAAPLMRAAHLDWSVAELGDVGLLLGAVLFVWWVARRAITAARLAMLFTLVLFSALVRKSDYLGLPFAFLFGASAVSVLILGLVWGFLTDGAETHEDTPGRPRDRKLLLFLGTFLYGIAIAAWAVIGKQVDLAEQLAQTTELGVITLGTSYLIGRTLDAVTTATALDRCPAGQ